MALKAFAISYGCLWSFGAHAYFSKELEFEDFTYRVHYLLDPSCTLHLDAADRAKLEAQLTIESTLKVPGYNGCLITVFDLEIRKAGLYSILGNGLITSMDIIEGEGFRSIPVLFENDTAVASIDLQTGSHRIYASGKTLGPVGVNQWGVGNSPYLVLPSASYHRQTFIVVALRSICLGILCMMCVFFLFMSREKNHVFLIYGSFIFVNIVFIESMRSLFAELLGYRSGQYYLSHWILFSSMFGSLTQLLLGVFFALFYEVKNNNPRLYILFKCQWSLVLAQIPLNLLGFKYANIYTVAVIMFGSLSMISIAIWYSIRKGGLYHLILLGYSSMLSCSQFYVLSSIGLFQVESLWARDVHLYGSTVEVILFSIATSLKLNSKMARQQRENSHVLQQLEKIVYPHQLQKIRDGLPLEHTMPTGKSEAFVLAFDIIGSSKIQHAKVKDFIETAIKRCIATMNEGYDGSRLSSDAYRIKVMGDGFLCSIGYPFVSPGSESTADAAVKLARRMVKIFDDAEKEFQYANPIHCAIGLAHGAIEAFFPQIGTKEYDLYGPAIVLATRYEQLRKTLFTPEDSDYIILQENVFQKLSPDLQQDFYCIDLAEKNIRVRDDESARFVYVWKSSDSIANIHVA